MSVTRNIAQDLFTALRSGEAIEPIRDQIDNDIPQAYAIQEEVVNMRVADGEKIVGKKIGLTSLAVQAQLGVDQPDYGVLFEVMDVSDMEAVSMDLLMQPKVEGELAFVLGEDLTGPEITMEQLKSAIKEVRASIEIVGSRIRDWNIKISDTIADNASGSHYVLGKKPLALADVKTADVEMALWKNGVLASEGNGAACMGDPLNAALWLAQTMARNGRPLLAGEVLLSGALGPMVPVVSGDQFRLEIDGFEAITLKFS